MENNFFIPVANTKPYIKIAFEGFAGSGKTYTQADVAIGLHKRIKSTKPIVMFDTEKAAKFLQNKFEAEGIQLMVKESRTLQDLMTTMKYCREGYSDILIIDSLSHVWEDTVESFKKKYNRTNLQFQDWGVLKPLWKTQFSDILVRDPYNIFFSGRAGYEYENEINEQTGKREIYKSGVKMKVEGETAYEPDILVLMERFEEILGKNKKVYRQATVVKDRSTLIDGKVFVNPTYKDFQPAVELILANPNTSVTHTETDSTGLFKTEEDKYKYIKDKEITLEKIEAELLRAWPSTGASDKLAKSDAVFQAFKTRSWKEVEGMGLDQLKNGLQVIELMIASELHKRFPDVDPLKDEKPEEGEAAKKMRAGIKKTKQITN